GGIFQAGQDEKHESDRLTGTRRRTKLKSGNENEKRGQRRQKLKAAKLDLILLLNPNLDSSLDSGPDPDSDPDSDFEIPDPEYRILNPED
ncbi:hypothetical protein KEM54_005264, partial [Ascosphaera aggregata]